MTDDTLIGPTPERLKRAGENVEAFAPDANLNHRALRMLDGHVLERLATRGIISGDQYNAGTQFYSDWYFGGLAASGVIDPGRVIVDGGATGHDNDRKLASLTRWTRAVQAVGLIHCQVLTQCVLLEEDLAAYGRRRYGQKAGKLARLQAQAALYDALEALDFYYYGKRQTGIVSGHVADITR